MKRNPADCSALPVRIDYMIYSRSRGQVLAASVDQVAGGNTKSLGVRFWRGTLAEAHALIAARPSGDQDDMRICPASIIVKVVNPIRKQVGKGLMVDDPVALLDLAVAGTIMAKDITKL